MSKKILALVLAIMMLAIVGCTGPQEGGSGNDNGTPGGRGDFYCYKGVVKTVGNSYITAEIIESDIAFGNYIILVNGNTTFETKDGGAASLGDVKVGDTVYVHVSGQVMLSYPPQISAQRIVIEK